MAGIEIGRWKAQGSAWVNFGRQAERLVAASAEIGAVEPTSQAKLKLGAKGSHEKKKSGEETVSQALYLHNAQRHLHALN